MIKDNSGCLPSVGDKPFIDNYKGGEGRIGGVLEIGWYHRSDWGGGTWEGALEKVRSTWEGEEYLRGAEVLERGEYLRGGSTCNGVLERMEVLERIGVL